MTTPRQKMIFAGTCVAVILLALIYWDWSRSHRYSLLNGKDGVTYKIDRKTGETFMIYGAKSRPVSAPIDEDDFDAAPTAVLSEIHGRGQFDQYHGRSWYQVKLHNASHWSIRQVTIELYHEEEGKVTWTRKYTVVCHLDPSSTDTIDFETVDAHLAGEIFWRVAAAKGVEL